jgi:ribosomal protein L7Ae-like RNA K-turn-binding protein
MNGARLASLLGLAQKAGKLVSGEEAVEHAVRSGKARLVLVAGDASDNTKKSYRDLSSYYQVACYEGLSKDEFGHATGKPPRAALAVTDAGFAKAVGELFAV